ncbi:phage antirepressor KilAC domain-containing protein [Lactiplantibacillus mudanjiangensis]|uniref:Oxidoreductase [Lactobacillus plantarum] n=1 Tax=Lactiplantibacillus mudanjiangensis TaxID=1296538 RepID=A0A660E1D8_9LACO|nr:phage antirepressor KilAC domain-containing protein [Lactiplantibacillus mudanjiangensis]VDG23705.1 oxidoreductase [Lactobacillus plantarum] [Lactiplantibacillus mudanjiangensis]VDG27850.1 oxidoreductase [Lactobacillus plantarum] [Lactiplantibacillus mudanjiangensis]
MNELIKVTIKNDQQVVSARDLHSGLNLKTRFSKWVSQNFNEFVENTDFTSVTTVTVVNNGARKPIQDYAITVDMAKQLSMMSHTERGKQYRLYFIQLEAKWNDPSEIVKRGYGILMDENIHLRMENKKMQMPALLGSAVSGSKASVNVGTFAKVLRQKGIEIGQNRLFDWLRTNGYLISDGTRHNVPTQKSMELKIMEVRESVVTTNHGSKTRFTPLITGKGQQYFVSKFLQSFK